MMTTSWCNWFAINAIVNWHFESLVKPYFQLKIIPLKITCKFSLQNITLVYECAHPKTCNVPSLSAAFWIMPHGLNLQVHVTSCLEVRACM